MADGQRYVPSALSIGGNSRAVWEKYTFGFARRTCPTSSRAGGRWFHRFRLHAILLITAYYGHTKKSGIQRKKGVECGEERVVIGLRTGIGHFTGLRYLA